MSPRYCAVFGCNYNTITKPELSFFSLPDDVERRARWLHLMCREDLMTKAPQHYPVCEIHFNPAVILPGSRRKMLKKNAIPSLHLPDLQNPDAPKVRKPPKKPPEKARRMVEKYVQTEENISHLVKVETEEASDNTQSPLVKVENEEASDNTQSPLVKVENEEASDDTQSFLVKEEHVEARDEIQSLLVKVEREEASDSAQISYPLFFDISQKRKLSSNILEYPKKIKLEEIDNVTEEYQTDTFDELCDRFLTKELAALVKAQTSLKFNYTRNRYHQNYRRFCWNLYYTSPQAYRLLESAISLPRPSTLNQLGIPITTKIDDSLMSMLKYKVKAMTDSEKNCSVVISAMTLKAHLFYHLKQDKIIGFQEIDGVQSPEPAKKALVVMVRGIFVSWKQPVGYALLSECRNDDEIARWIDKLLERLFEIGLNIRTFVSDMSSDLYNAAKMRSVTIERPYFFINNRKIYYIYDAPHLIKLVHNNLISCDFHFQDRVAKYEHIKQFYENDKQKSFKLAHKLTNNHIHPTNFERKKFHYATQLLSNTVAAGISTYIDFNVIQESGRDTVELIKNMNDLFDTLNSSNLKDDYEYRRAFCGKESQMTFFNKMLSFFQNLKLIAPKNGLDVTSNVKFIEGFQITINSILLLFKDLKSEGSKYLLTRRLNQDVLENFFGQIRSKNGLATEPTSRQFILAFQKLFLSYIVKLPKTGYCADDLGNLLIQTNAFGQLNDEASLNGVNEIPGPNDGEPDSHVQIMSSEYNQINLPEKKSLFYVCGFLLKKCAEYHNDCPVLKSYLKVNQSISSECQHQRYRNCSEDTNSSLLVVPPEYFVQFVVLMEEIFRLCFQSEHLNDKIAAFIYKETDKISFSMPCPCFPMAYLRKLFIRLRIYSIIKFNNKLFRKPSRRRTHFSVNNLQ